MGYSHESKKSFVVCAKFRVSTVGKITLAECEEEEYMTRGGKLAIAL
jgi:hypothetical protein